MHPFMIHSFEPFYRKGSLLELGSYTGDFTRRFLPHFDDIPCVEAFDVATEAAKKVLGRKIQFIQSTFESTALPRRYDNIVLTHVLEHDAVEAGLKVVHRPGIFFKALADFQWDRLLKTDIVSKEYLEGCYQLGQIYLDLCSSMFLRREKGVLRG
jgi:hypothetical protein